MSENREEKQGALEVHFTDKAIEQAKKLLARDKPDAPGLRIAVADGGCSGHSYQLSFEMKQKTGDTIVELDGLRVYVDPVSAPYLKGTVVDYVSGLYGGGFKFSNPNATGTCGCGTSFSA